MGSFAGPCSLLSGSIKYPRAVQAVSPASSVGRWRQSWGWRRWDSEMSHVLLWASTGVLLGATKVVDPTTGMGPASSPCVLEGLEVPHISDRLCDTCPMGSKHALPTKFQALQAAPRYIHRSVLRSKYFAESERFCHLTNSGTAAPGAKFCFPEDVHFPPGSWLGVWQHLPSPACRAAALGQARSFGHGVGRGRAAPPCPPRAEGSAERKLLLTELRALPDWG